jgi:uncharacterized membrane protein YjfL (UPF0719 family)
MYWLGAMVANTTHRYVQVQGAVGVGRLKLGVGPVMLPMEDVGISECGSPHGDQAYLGPPPARCRTGRRIDGVARQGYAEVVVPSRPLAVLVHNATLNKLIRYPAKIKVEIEVRPWGHFERCYVSPPDDMYDGLYCMEQTSVSYYVWDGNKSAVWLNPVPRNNMLVLYCLIQVYVLALLASSANPKSDPTLLPLAANTALGGSVYLAYVVSRGSTVEGLAEEVGTAQADLVCTLLAVVCVALAGSAWLVGLLRQGKPLAVGPLRLAVHAATPTASVAIRELLEVPMLLSLAIMWPPHHGRLFATILNLAIGCVVPTVAGRAVYQFSTPSNTLRLWAAAMAMAGTFGGTVLLLPIMSQSGAVQRGLPAVVLCATMTTNALLAGYVVSHRYAIRLALYRQQLAAQDQNGASH